MNKIINEDFAVFIMVHGRPNKMWTYKSLRSSGYTGKIYLVADDLDDTVEDYKKKYKDELIVFDKLQSYDRVDSGDNSKDLRSTLYSANTIPHLAKEKGIKHFFIMCDDYTRFVYKFDKELNYKESQIKSLDSVFAAMLKYYKNIDCLTMALAQNGDFIGGKDAGFSKNIKPKRKAMNTFLCNSDKPIKFMGRLNEDVNTYVNLGSTGKLFMTIPNVSIIQKPTQNTKGGLSDVYLDNGTYVKSFFSVMYNPSCVKISQMGEKHRRIHHRIKWKYAVPKIVNETHKKTN